MKKNRKKQKGFSLVELIVVIAVMAVLVVVLAPAYLRYVDKSRLQKDVSAIGEVIEAIKIAAAEESVSAEIAIPTDTSKAFAEYGVLSYAQVIIHGQSSESVETGTISANKMKTDIGWADVGHIVEGIFTGSLTVPREEAPNLHREVVATVGEKVEFGSKNLKKLDVILTVTRDADYKIHVTVNVDSFKHYDDVYEALQVFEDTGFDNSAKCAHNWVDSVCTKCNEKCTSHSWRNGSCSNCGKVCEHSWGSDGKCTICRDECEHSWSNGVCVGEGKCGMTCTHENWWDGACAKCGYACDHGGTTGDNGKRVYNNIDLHIGSSTTHIGHTFQCEVCGKWLDENGQQHVYKNHRCVCGATCKNDKKIGICLRSCAVSD